VLVAPLELRLWRQDREQYLDDTVPPGRHISPMLSKFMLVKLAEAYSGRT
jgi:hypothetical protein